MNKKDKCLRAIMRFMKKDSGHKEMMMNKIKMMQINEVHSSQCFDGLLLVIAVCLVNWLSIRLLV